MNRNYYSIYGPHIEAFLAFKRSLGFKFKGVEWIFYLFDQLVVDRDEYEVGISKELADEWCKKRSTEKTTSLYHRVQLFRQFSIFLSDTGYPSYLPSLPSYKSTYKPYIFSKTEIAAIFSVSDKLTISKGHSYSSALTVPVLLRLLYATGLRISEAVALTLEDVNLEEKYLVLHNCKNGQDRLVPFSESLTQVLRSYLEYRKSSLFKNVNNYFFVRSNGDACCKSMAYDWFRTIIYRAGIPHGGKGFGPRLHDLRHSFAVHSLASMADAGVDLYYSLPVLSTYLGHLSLAATDQYVKLTSDMYPSIIAGANKIAPCLFPDINNTNDHDTN